MESHTVDIAVVVVVKTGIAFAGYLLPNDFCIKLKREPSFKGRTKNINLFFLIFKTYVCVSPQVLSWLSR